MAIDCDIFLQFRVQSDDCAELMEKFSKAFAVDMRSYLWYFHHAEESSAALFFAWLWPPPDRRVPRIPITPKLLLSAAVAGRWPVSYPSHVLHARRYDLIAAWIVGAILLLLIATGFLCNGYEHT